MDNLEKLTRLKKKAADAQREADRAQGALERVQEQLVEEFDCHSIKDAKKLLVKLQEEEQNKADEFDRALKKFEDKYGEALA